MTLNYYEELGVSSEATTQDIQEAYKAAAKKLHPDANAGHEKWAENQMKRLNVIRDVLFDVCKRAEYDAMLRSTDKGKAQAAPVQPQRPRQQAATGSWLDVMSKADAARVLMVQQPEEGTRRFEQLLKAHGDDPMIWFMRGRALAAIGRVKEARQDLRFAASTFRMDKWRANARAELAKLRGRRQYPRAGKNLDEP